MDRGRNLTLCLPLLMAAVAPLHAQFTTYGCPGGNDANQINGFTAGTPADSEICLVGTFQTSLVYQVTLTRTDTNVSVTVQAAASGNLLTATVPASSGFYASIGGTQPVPVDISIFSPQLSGTNQTGTFQINPPLASGGPVFVSAVNTPVSWNLFTGGTQPSSDEFENGSVPNGMNPFPTTGNTWSGTPSQTGTFPFSTLIGDAWGNSISNELAAYIVPTPQITGVSPPSTPIGSNSVPLTINGNGFIAPTSIPVGSATIPEPGSTVMVAVVGGSVVSLTPTNYSANQLTVTLPSSLFLSEGPISLNVSNVGVATSNNVLFLVEPVLTSLSTTVRTAGTPAFTLGLTGAGFASGATVLLNGANLPTTFVNSTSLTATVPAITTPGVETISVVNPDQTVSNPLTLNVVAAPVLRSLSPSSATAGAPGFALTVTGVNFLPGMTVTFNNSALPTTLVQNQQNNQLVANVPASAIASAGTVPVGVITADGYIANTLAFTIVPSGPPPLQLTTFPPLPAGIVNTPYSFTFATTGGAGGNMFSIVSGALPAGLQLSSAGAVSGTPATYGSSQFTLQVVDSAGSAVSRQFTINIAPAPLTLTTGPLANTIVNTPISVQFAGTGGIPPYTFVEFGALPPGVTITSAGLLSGTPAKTGTYPFVVFLDDSTGAWASKNYSLNIALPGLLITTPSPLPAGQINVPYTTQLAATGGVGAPYTWSATGLPAGLTIANNSGLIAGIPRASGTFTVAVTVGDLSAAAATQNYTLLIASANLVFSGATLANGSVGIPYTSVVSVMGGIGPYSYTAAGLPPGLSLSSTGTLSGTPATAGAYTISVTATDTSGATVSGSYKVTIAPQLTVTPSSIPNAILGTAISPVQLTAAGGTPPYQWQSANLPPGLSLGLNGTLSGTPSAGGTFPFTVYVVDSNGVLASGMEQLTVAPPSTAAGSITGLPSSASADTQQFLNVSLAAAYPSTVTANLTLTFTPASGVDDPMVQFSTGGRTAQIVIPAGSTSGTGNLGVQIGTVAGTIAITAQFLAGTVNVTPAPAPSATIIVPAAGPVITAVTAKRSTTDNTFTVFVTGYVTNEDVETAAFTFTPSEGSTLAMTQVSPPVASLFTAYYGGSGPAKYGSQFTLTQVFDTSGSPSAVFSVSVALANRLGTSPAVSAVLQ